MIGNAAFLGLSFGMTFGFFSSIIIIYLFGGKCYAVILEKIKTCKENRRSENAKTGGIAHIPKKLKQLLRKHNDICSAEQASMAQAWLELLLSPAYSSDLVSHTWRYNKRLGKDSQGLNHKAISIKHVFRVHNDQLWNIYSKSFSQQLPTDNNRNTPNDTSNNGDLIISGLTSHLEDNPILTKTVPAFIDMINYNNHKYPFPLKDSEVHLFHGTKRKNVESIVRNGFDLSKARRGLYGKALYLAESSEKADQYTDDKFERKKSNLVMFIVRVNLGRVYIQKEHYVHRDSPQHDTVIAGLDKRFREFLVFDTNRSYPEYIVLYDRVM